MPTGTENVCFSNRPFSVELICPTIGNHRPEKLNAFFGSPSATGLARPRLRSRASSRSFCIACGSTEPNSTGRRRLLPSKGEFRVPANGGKRRPCRDDGDGEFDRFCASVRRATAIATLNRQRHLTPSCGGIAPYRG